MSDKTAGTPVQSQGAELAPSRAWQACQPCRRRKVKCDGKQPCFNCSSRGQTCEFPEAKDHASVSRYYALSFEARFQQMDSMCQKLGTITAQVLQAVETLGRDRTAPQSNSSSLSEDLVSAATVLHSLPGNDTSHAVRTQTHGPATSMAEDREDPRTLLGVADLLDDDDDDSSDMDESNDEQERNTSLDSEGVTDQAAAFVTDSYGRLRFVGGATNKMLIDAAKGMSPGSRTLTTQLLDSNKAAEAKDAQGGDAAAVAATAAAVDDGDVELPLFVRGKVWPELPFLPKPEQLARPPQYISDLLVGLYFDKLHYTFPVVYKPHFMRSYSKMLRCGQSSAALDKEFLMVFFSVCACASGLLPSSGPDRGFPGIEYYEKALLLHYSSPGQASMERVQCLGLLAMCTASWNTLTQSWSLAGLAVRASMDIGLHVNSRFMMPPVAKSGSSRPVEIHLRNQIARRAWWSVFCLERTVSICLGRPMAVDDKDCCCELPLDISDEDLERYCQTMSQNNDDHSHGHGHGQPHRPHRQHDNGKSSSPPLTGFLAFARLCQISVRIQQLGSPLRVLRQLQLSLLGGKKPKRYMSRVAALDQSLREWLETLPDSVRFSANAVEQREGGDSGLVMCVIIFMLHAGSLLNLYRYVARDSKHANSFPTFRTDSELEEATVQCVSAAQSCISAAELVRDIVPPSHYLAICVHCLTLSGVALLSMSKQPPDARTRADVNMCISLLKDLELRWTGACRSRTIIENLLADCCREQPDDQPHEKVVDDARDQWSAGAKRPFSEFDSNMNANLEESLWRDMPWTDLLQGGDIGRLGQLSPWSEL